MMTLSFRAVNSPTFTNIQHNLFTAMFSVGIAADVILTAMLCVALHKSRSGLKRTNSIINLLIMYSIKTGGIACGCAITTLVIFVCSPLGLIYAPFYVQTANLYLVSLLATLNYRRTIQTRIQQPLSLDYAAFDRCTTASSEQGQEGHLSEQPASATILKSRTSFPKLPHVFRIRSRQSSIGSKFEATEKGQIFEQTEPAEIILDRVMNLGPSAD
ncbi:uncharacterized protein B0H18DRAFT_70567 [Fomitopsis serialis]|uniref:uncharacterized protein n=1 Tax=Fomitopsis serialis TaxID=139415 RepID=UPI0020083E0C|nr:uncharacterized protein B0H18DRAFT_70567 [Neoantrodia serialis]KAH9931924.1 hypothetical protein B0H18DRAFT_70567 [Neoantrodia serialis]